MGKVRLCDIASDAGVSVSAVSRILSCDDSRKHSDETKKRVVASAEKLGWFDSVSDKAIKAKKPLRVRRVYSSSVNAYQKALFDKGFNKAFDVVSSHIPVELVDDNEELAVVFGDEFDSVSDVPVIHAGFMALSGCFNIVADLIKAFSSFENKAFIGNRIYDSGFELSEYAFSLDPVSGYEAAGRYPIVKAMIPLFVMVAYLKITLNPANESLKSLSLYALAPISFLIIIPGTQTDKFATNWDKPTFNDVIVRGENFLNNI